MRIISNYCRILRANLDIGDIEAAGNMAIMAMESIKNSKQAAYYLNFVSKYPEVSLDRSKLLHMLSKYHSSASIRDLCLMANAMCKFNISDPKFTEYFTHFIKNNITSFTIIDACQSLFYLSKIGDTSLYLQLVKYLANRQLSSHAITSIITSARQLSIDPCNYGFVFKKIPAVIPTFSSRQASTVLGYGAKYLNTNSIVQLSDVIIRNKYSSARDLVVALNALAARNNSLTSSQISIIYLKLNSMDLSLLDCIGVLNSSSKMAESLPREAFTCCKQACNMILNNLSDYAIEEISHLPLVVYKLKWLNTCKLLSQIHSHLLYHINCGNNLVPHLFAYLRGLSLNHAKHPLQLHDLYKFKTVLLDNLNTIPLRDYAATINASSLLFPDMKPRNIQLLKSSISEHVEYATFKDYALLMKSLQRWDALDDEVLTLFAERVAIHINLSVKDNPSPVSPVSIASLCKILLDKGYKSEFLINIMRRYIRKYSDQLNEQQVYVIGQFLEQKNA